MSNFTDYGENWVCNFIRGNAPALPAAFDVALLTSVGEDTYSEVSWSGYSRQSIQRTLQNFSGTQGNGSTAASNGNSHTTVNNVEIDFGAAGGSGTIGAVGLFAGSNMFAYSTLNNPLTVASGDVVKLDAYALVFTLGATGGCTDVLSNKLIDYIWRGQAYTYPSTMYMALYLAAPSNNTRGTEVSGGGYSRVPMSNSAWSAPNAGTITTEQNLQFPTPTSNWGSIVACGFHDAQTNGNLLWWATVPSPKTIVNGGAAPRFDAGAVTLQVL